jgi:sugar lactone lactonase YvrE
VKKNLLVKVTLTTALILVVLFQFSCKKDSDSTTVPVLLTNSIIAGVTTTTATSGGTVTSGGSATVTAVGVCYSSTSQSPSITDSHTSETVASSFTSNITGLTAGTTYYVRAYASSTAGTGYGGVVKFTTSTAANATTATVSTFVGNGTGGFVNGTGTGAQLYTPLGMAADAAGNLYVADQFNHVIRKITPAGVVTTFCGNGTNGHVDGAATVAQFSSPNAIAVDKSGNVYVTDQGSNLIIKITPDGTATTLAGIGASGYVNSSSPLKAAFNNMQGIAVDAAGNVFVADAGNNRIREVNTKGSVTTLAGSGYITQVDSTSTYASFNHPCGLAFNSKGLLYVADNYNHAIRTVTTDGTVKTVIGNNIQTGLIGNPIAITFDASDNLYIVDVTGRVLRYNSSTSSILYDLAGTSGTYGFADGVNTLAQFNSPSGIALISGVPYVSDSNNNRIRKVVIAN